MRHGHILGKQHKAKNAKRDPIDRIVYLVAFAAPAFEMPQLFTIYSRHSAKDVSAVTWGCFAIASFVWLLYAVRHKLKPLIISYLLFTTIETVTLASIILYHQR